MQLTDKQCADRARLGCGLQDRRTARGQRVHEPGGGDRVGEVPGPCDEHHLVRLPVELLGQSLVLQRQVSGVEGKVDGLAHLWVALPQCLAGGDRHGSERLSALCRHDLGDASECLPALLPGRACPTLLGYACAREGVVHISGRRHQRGLGRRGHGEDRLSPRPIVGGCEVGVGDVGEASVGRKVDLLAPPVLVAVAGDLDGVAALERGTEALELSLPGRGVRREVEERAQEVLGPRILVKAAGQVGDGSLAVGLLHDGGVEQQRSGGIAHGARLRRSHALEHLDLDHARIVEGVAQGERPRDVEEVVRGDSQSQCTRLGGAQGGVEHALVRRVDIRLGVVGRLRPVVELGLHLLHREVGALDESDLDGRAPRGVALIRPRDESVECGVGVGNVGLEHDARGHLRELRLVEHADEGLDGELQVAVLLHVEIDEGPVSLCDAVERGQALGDPSERVLPGEHIEIGA